MATYTDVSSGGAKLSGCGISSHVRTYATRFGPGDITYSIAKARRGLLERVVIRKQHVIDPIFVQGGFFVYYEDTFHSLWNEEDLTSHANAIDLAKTYYEQRIADSEALKIC